MEDLQYLDIQGKIIVVPPCQFIEVTEGYWREFHVVGCKCQKAREDAGQLILDEYEH